MSFWDKIQKDIKRNINDVLKDVKEKRNVVSKKIGELTEEGKRQLKIFNLNMKVQEELSKLGGQVYDLSAKKAGNPFENKKVAAVIARIKKLESQISRLEKKSGKKTGKTSSGKTGK